MVGLTFFQIIPSIGTGCKNKNACQAKNSIGCAGCIYVFELIFCAFLLLNLVIIFLECTGSLVIRSQRLVLHEGDDVNLLFWLCACVQCNF